MTFDIAFRRINAGQPDYELAPVFGLQTDGVAIRDPCNYGGALDWFDSANDDAVFVGRN